MNKKLSIYLFSVIFIAAFLLFRFYNEYKQIQKTESLIALEESKAIKNFLIAFRGTYQDIFIKNHITINKNTIKLLPVSTTATIGKHLSKLSHQRIILRTVSDRPRNPKNRASQDEISLIKQFKKNQNMTYIFTKTNSNTYKYVEPIFIKQRCLKCHAKREDAPPYIQQTYQTAYNYKPGDIRGLITVELEKNNINKLLYTHFNINLIITLFLFLVSSIIGFFILKNIFNKDEKQQKLIEEQTKMASMGQMINNIAHQWRQPLSAITANADDIKLAIEFDDYNEKDTLASIDKINQMSHYLSQTIEDFREFFQEKQETKTFFLDESIKKTISLFRYMSHKNINIELSTKHININNIENKLTQSLLNILKNAKDALEGKESKVILIKVFTNNSKAIITIQDNAGGINKDVIQHIFEPYFTTKHQSVGTGIGLYMTQQMISHMKGVIEVENRTFKYNGTSYQGACFTITLPKNNV